MRSTSLWQRYINIIIMIMNITHCSVFYLKHNVSETGFCLLLQVEPTQLGPINRNNLYLWS
jgi:hypothetical protein